MPTNVAETVPSSSSQRIVSIDALRGFDMFWIVGGEGFAAAILQFCRQPLRETLQPQLDHAEWEGFRFFDLIFPLFVFLAGMSALLSLSKIVEEKGKAAAYWRVLRRAVLLYLLGIFYYGGFANPPGIRFMGVLQRIALCYLFTGLAVINLRVRGIIVLLAVLLAGYWAWLSFVPLPGAKTISFAAENNWPNYIDGRCLPGWKWDDKTWDPEGLLSTLPAIGTCLLGVLAAELLRSRNISSWLKAGCLIGGGILGVVGGYYWGHQFPIIKKLWTSSFVLVAGGYSCILMGAFYLVIDVWKLRRWAIGFLWIGTNAITLYVAENVLDFRQLAARLVGGNVQTAIGRLWGGTREAPGGPAGTLLLSGVALALMLLLARFLYRRKIFLRL